MDDQIATAPGQEPMSAAAHHYPSTAAEMDEAVTKIQAFAGDVERDAWIVF